MDKYDVNQLMEMAIAISNMNNKSVDDELSDVYYSLWLNVANVNTLNSDGSNIIENIIRNRVDYIIKTMSEDVNIQLLEQYLQLNSLPLYDIMSLI